ncbi:MAG: hypothetical protein A3B68_02855 [Candidatus Melainabacteria bacterium RIFCSPHIGHO2_02_FULL_34_12]|nr:MAG: hypothetical protein A3B68_02855 [Candidatus Melainabacteria bacterium RIFCSPHIGHO2_02_FULL_34_12]
MKDLIKKDSEVEKILSQVKDIAPEVVNDFVSYWSIRKSPSFVADELITKMTHKGSWLSLIKANHEFRTVFGDDFAEELICAIEKNTETYHGKSIKS